MESQELLTQAIPSTSSSNNNEVVVDDNVMIIDEQPPVASTSTLPLESEVAIPVEPVELTIEELIPFPSDVNVSAFAAAETLAARAPGAIQAKEPEVYTPRINGPEIPTATGIVKASATTKIITDDEMGKAKTDEVMALEKAGFINESEVLKLSVAELKIRGLGRGKTGK